MNCAQCGYLIDEFDDGCPRCYGLGLPPRPEPRLPRIWLWKRWLWKGWLAWSIVVALVVAMGYTVWLPGWKQSQQENVQEAAIRYCLAPRHDSSQNEPFKGFVFVRVDGHDPSSHLLSRFHNDIYQVRKLSEARTVFTRVFPDPYEYFDLNSSERGGYLSIGHLEWHGPFNVEVEVGGDGAGNKLLLQRRGGRWVLTDKWMTWIA